MAIFARTRTRVAEAPPKKLTSPWDVPIIGGPKQWFRLGFPVFTPGRATRLWPYYADSVFIGYRLDEYAGKGGQPIFYCTGDSRPIATHAWQMRNGELRYLGKFQTKERALGQIELAHTRAAAPVTVKLQPVAARLRIRKTPTG